MAKTDFNEAAWLESMVKAVKTHCRETKYFWPMRRGQPINGSNYEDETVNKFVNNYIISLKQALEIKKENEKKEKVGKVIYEILVTWGQTYHDGKKNHKKVKDATLLSGKNYRS